jgi:hypothetical protein
MLNIELARLIHIPQDIYVKIIGEINVYRNELSFGRKGLLVTIKTLDMNCLLAWCVTLQNIFEMFLEVFETPRQEFIAMGRKYD